MKVILRQDFEQLGKTGDTVEVKRGYGINYLIPKKIAYPALIDYNLRSSVKMQYPILE